jgi:hypothetical protein
MPPRIVSRRRRRRRRRGILSMCDTKRICLGRCHIIHDIVDVRVLDITRAVGGVLLKHGVQAGDQDVDYGLLLLSFLLQGPAREPQPETKTCPTLGKPGRAATDGGGGRTDRCTLRLMAAAYGPHVRRAFIINPYICVRVCVCVCALGGGTSRFHITPCGCSGSSPDNLMVRCTAALHDMAATQSKSADAIGRRSWVSHFVVVVSGRGKREEGFLLLQKGNIVGGCHESKNQKRHDAHCHFVNAASRRIRPRPWAGLAGNIPARA